MGYSDYLIHKRGDWDTNIKLVTWDTNIKLVTWDTNIKLAKKKISI